jgi:tellurite resistance protein TerC
MSYFPVQDYWLFYVCFTAFVLAVLALDLGVFHRKAHEVSVKEAGIWSAVWVTLALVFNYLFYLFSLAKFSADPRLLAIPGFDPQAAAKQSALEFLTGYVVEKSLAVDNIFIFAMVFSYFAVPRIYQHRILFYGIIGALIFRAIFIALGSYLMAYHWVVLFFGGLLLLTGVKMFFAPAEEIEPEKNILIRLLKKIFRVHPKFEGGSFFIKKDGLLYATPMFITLMFIEFSDIIFAVDSVPAIFAITKEPLIVFTSNIFAILGLRSMYFMLSGIMDRFAYIKYGLASVLIFVGFKMVYLNGAFGGKFPILWSLSIIASLIGSSIVFSLLMDRRKRNAAKRELLKDAGAGLEIIKEKND